MIAFLKRIRSKLKLNRPEEQDGERRIVEDLIQAIDAGGGEKRERNQGLVRRLRENVFTHLQRTCEAPLWTELLKHARDFLVREREAKGLSPCVDWSNKEIGRALGGIDHGTISNAIAGNEAPISLGRLLVPCCISGSNGVPWENCRRLRSCMRNASSMRYPSLSRP